MTSNEKPNTSPENKADEKNKAAVPGQPANQPNADPKKEAAK